MLGLFDKLILPISNYSGEVWEFSKADVLERIHLRFFKQLLGIRVETQNNFIYGERRHLTPLGKITVIKSLLIPCLNHLLLALLNPSEKLMKEINDILYTFLWEGTSSIKYSVIWKNYLDGGLKMINTNAFISALKQHGLDGFVLISINGQKWQETISMHNFRLWYRVHNKNIKKK